MVVRFDSQKLYNNTSSNIGVEKASERADGPSEVESIVNEAKQKSNTTDASITPAGEDSKLGDVQAEVTKQITDEEQEPGPELSWEGNSVASSTEDKKENDKTSNDT